MGARRLHSPSSRPAVAGDSVAVSRGISRTARDLARERRFLTAAAGGDDPFVAHAVERLELGETEYGSSWSTRPVGDLLAEIAEEAADQGAWAALAVQSFDAAPLSAVERARLADVLSLVATHGARAHGLLVAATPEGGGA